MGPGSLLLPTFRMNWTIWFVPRGKIQSGVWPRASPPRTRCSAAKGPGRWNHEVFLRGPADTATCLPASGGSCPPSSPGTDPDRRSLRVAPSRCQNIDSGSDDTLFPAYLAPRLGIDLTNAPVGEAGTIGGPSVPYRYAKARLRLSDGYEECEWEAVVGFVTIPMRWAVLGHASALQYFDLQLLGFQREVALVPNLSFPGSYVVHRSPPT